MKRTEKAQSANLADLTLISGWSNLQSTEQTLITTETLAIATCLQSVSQAKIAVGEHLSKVRVVLEPKRIFTKYLKTMFHLSKATAYRYIDLYEAAKSALPANILQIAMMRPDDRLTLRAIKDAPKPPRTTNVVEINQYLDKLAQRKPAEHSAKERKAEDVKRAMFHASHLLLAKLQQGREKKAVLLDVFGMLLTDAGITVDVTIKPVAIPETFRAVRGRPRSIPKAA
jgi:hypothetical protein